MTKARKMSSAKLQMVLNARLKSMRFSSRTRTGSVAALLTLLYPPLIEHLALSSCSGDLGSIPGSGRSPEEGNGNPLAWEIPRTE